MIRRLLLFTLPLLLIAGILLAPSYLRYMRTRGAVPPGVRVAGLEFGSADADAVADALNRRFAEPLLVYYGDQRIILRPQILDYQVDVAAILAEARSYETPGHLLRVWVAEALERPLPAVDLPLRYTLDRDRLDAWLSDLAARYDRPATPPVAAPDGLALLPGQAGRQLDLAASRDRIIAALSDPHTRTVNLIVREAAPPPPDRQLLADLLQARVDRFGGVAGLFLHHLATGQEVAINADVAYSGMGTLKLAILIETMRKLDAPLAPYTTRMISATATLAGTAAANELLTLIGDGDIDAGVATLNRSLRRLGLQNTFMAAAFERTGPTVRTPANTRRDIWADPDPYIQTTPREIGLLMQMLVECARGGGTLLAAYRDQISQAECQQIVDYLRLNEASDMILAGVPKGTQAIHRYGYAGDTRGDVAAIWGPAGPYVLSIFLYQRSWLDANLASGTMADLSKIVWSYFTLLGE
ncbi:MAG: serine hydrolase [Anaerolineae bacterium]